MLVVHATRDCGQTPRIVFAFEELGVDWRIEWHDAGYFLRSLGSPGPMLEDGDLRLFYSGVIIRHAARAHGSGRLLGSTPSELATVEQWMEFYLIGFRSAIMALAEQRGRPADGKDHAVIERETAILRKSLGRLETQIAPAGYLAGDFSAADVVYTALTMLTRMQFDLKDFPRVVDYLARLTARPTWGRSQERLEAARAA